MVYALLLHYLSAGCLGRGCERHTAAGEAGGEDAITAFDGGEY